MPKSKQEQKEPSKKERSKWRSELDQLKTAVAMLVKDNYKKSVESYDSGWISSKPSGLETQPPSSSNQNLKPSKRKKKILGGETPRFVLDKKPIVPEPATEKYWELRKYVAPLDKKVPTARVYHVTDVTSMRFTDGRVTFNATNRFAIADWEKYQLDGFVVQLRAWRVLYQTLAEVSHGTISVGSPDVGEKGVVARQGFHPHGRMMFHMPPGDSGFLTSTSTPGVYCKVELFGSDSMLPVVFEVEYQLYVSPKSDSMEPESEINVDK
jgi:hypothetical protein